MYYKLNRDKVRLIEIIEGTTKNYARVCDSTDAYRIVPVSRLVPIGNSKRLVE